MQSAPCRRTPLRPRIFTQSAVAPVEGQLAHTIQAHAEGGLYALVPYTLYKGDAEVERGLTDEFGRIRIAHQDGTPRYRVVLGNGEEFVLQASACFDAGAAVQAVRFRDFGLDFAIKIVVRKVVRMQRTQALRAGESAGAAWFASGGASCGRD